MADTTQARIIGADIEFMDADGLRYRGVVMDIRDGTAFAAVRGYPMLFPCLPVTPQQAAFVTEQARRPSEETR